MTVKGQECPITPTEWRLLRQFLMNRRQLLTYELLLERLWDSGGQFVDKHALAVNVNRLRGKLKMRIISIFLMYMGWDINGLFDVDCNRKFVCGSISFVMEKPSDNKRSGSFC